MAQEEEKEALEEEESTEVEAAEPADEEGAQAAESSGDEDLAAQVSALQETLAEVEAKLAEAEGQAAEYKDGWQRAQASFANFRKRTQAEQANWRSNANAQLLSRLVPVLDDFKRAFDAIPEALEDNGWLDGIRLIQRKVKAILDTENVTPIDLEPGDPFDPKYHEAVLHQVVPGFDDGAVVAVVEAGYMLGDRVLRPAMVVVAKAPADAPVASPADEAEAGTDEPDVIEADAVEVIPDDVEEEETDKCNDAGDA